MQPYRIVLPSSVYAEKKNPTSEIAEKNHEMRFSVSSSWIKKIGMVKKMWG